MTRLAERQRQFSEALLDPALPTPDGIVGPDGCSSPKRFSVYRNNVVVGLTEVLKDAFPAVRRLVGSDFFAAMAGAFVRADPPHSPVLLEYGQTFPTFIGGFAPAASVPYLADVARIEWAWKEAYHAPDACALNVSDFQAIPVDVLPSIRLSLHPSLRVVRSLMPALTIWRMNVADGVPGSVVIGSEGEDTLVIRAAAIVEARSMPPGGLDFITALNKRLTVVEATEFALTRAPNFDLAANLAGLIEAGAFASHDRDSHAGTDGKRITI
jgi:hypothetical protein